jgi:hypothetical protein
MNQAGRFGSSRQLAKFITLASTGRGHAQCRRRQIGHAAQVPLARGGIGKARLSPSLVALENTFIIKMLA